MFDESPTELQVDPLVGQDLAGTYHIVRKIGEGGMGAVYEARHTRLPKRFAIKVMRKEWAADQVSYERFRREAETTSALGNVHIAEVVDFNQLPDGSPFMVMEFLEGQDLSDRLEKHGPVPFAKGAAIIDAVASALMGAHQQGILHRDLKPANIFICRRDREGEHIKLLDFGAAKWRGKSNDAAPLTALGQVVGTPWYMSPEQAQGYELDARSDQFSLAVVLYEAVTGRLPFEADNPTAVLWKIVEDPHTPVREYRPDLPEGLDALFDRALSKDPAARFGSVAELADEVKALVTEAKAAAPAAPRVRHPTVAAPPTPAPAPAPALKHDTAEGEAVRRPGLSSPVVVGAALGMALIVALGVAYVLAQSSAPAPPPQTIIQEKTIIQERRVEVQVPVAAEPKPRPKPRPDVAPAPRPDAPPPGPVAPGEMIQHL
jgi:serine/threonine-protein kinase